MIDTHCHIDQYAKPLQIANECERLGIVTIGMTNLPSHFELGYEYLSSYKKVRLALGMHPLLAESHQKELQGFFRNIDKTSYIGEVGLDFSKEGIASKNVQLNTFQCIISAIKGKKKIISLHSRKAEREIFHELCQHNIGTAIFHWYSGPLSIIENIAREGFMFSINPAMIKSKSGQEIIRRIPIANALTESDGPFISVKNRFAKPNDIIVVHAYLSSVWGMSEKDVELRISENFSKLIQVIS